MSAKITQLNVGQPPPIIVMPVGPNARNQAMEYYVRLLGLVRPETDGRQGVYEEDIAAFAHWPKQGTYVQN